MVSNPYGAFQRLDSGQGVIGHFLSKALKGDQVQIYGDGQIVRDYLYVDDLAEAFERALVYQGDEVIMNISSGVGTSLVQLLDAIEAVTDCRIKRQYLPTRDFDVSVNILSNDRAKAELGWAPKTDLRRGLHLTARALRNRG
ncbi:MAG: GDP-mannose 4,6-dehydratase [Rhizobiaceae bacterium]|nr:GDP-mannose 4,6-dehydratase [Rhizobiaceae bacterium]